jgi:hypothetical protein
MTALFVAKSEIEIDPDKRESARVRVTQKVVDERRAIRQRTHFGHGPKGQSVQKRIRLLRCAGVSSLARSCCVLSILSLSTNYRCPYATSAIFIVLASDSGGQIAIDRDSVTGIEHRDWGSNERTR